MNVSRAIARKTITDLGINTPSDLMYLEDICWALGAFVQYEDLDGAEARISMDDEQAVITVQQNIKYPARTRFSVGHELGHFLLHKGKQNNFLCNPKDMQDWFASEAQKQLEVEANEFSIELLIPHDFALPILKKQKPSWSAVQEIAETFQMSLSASIKRFIELSPEAVAAVYFNKNGVTHHFRSKSFEDNNFWVDKGPLSRATFAFDAAQGKAPDGMMSVSASDWFKVKPWLEDETILESARFFENLNFGVSLLWVNNGKLLK